MHRIGGAKNAESTGRLHGGLDTTLSMMAKIHVPDRHLARRLFTE